jgi:hypothetical protein
MNYTRETEFGTWRIEEDSQRNWVVLKLKRDPDRWRAINIFYTVGGAAAAVACGETSDPLWDQLEHDEAEFVLERWQAGAEPDNRVSAA